MAEFLEVCRNAERMLKASFLSSDKTIFSAKIWPFCLRRDASVLTDENKEPLYFYMTPRFKNAAEAEENIMKWAAEHPEPVLPTLGEWLCSIGLAKRVYTDIPAQMSDGSFMEPPSYIECDLKKRITPEVAERCGIQPKGD